MASPLDEARRENLAHALDRNVMAFAMDQAFLAIHNGGASRDEVTALTRTFIRAVSQATRELTDGLTAIVSGDLVRGTTKDDAR